MRAGSGWFGLRALPPGAAGRGLPRLCHVVSPVGRFVTHLVMRLRHLLAHADVSQGRRDSNPQPPVLETGLYQLSYDPSGSPNLPARAGGTPFPGALARGAVEPPKGRVYAQGTAPVEPRGAPDTRADWTDAGGVGRMVAMTQHGTPGLPPHRRHRRVRHARRRRQGQGAQGRRPPGDRLRRRRARLPDPRLHRRGGGRRPAATRAGTATPRPAGCPSCRRRSRAKTAARLRLRGRRRRRSW